VSAPTSLLIIPAAGLGTRLAYNGPKCLFEVAGKAMLGHVIERHQTLVDEIAVVVSPRYKLDVSNWLKEQALDGVKLFLQESPTGMLDAIMCPAFAYKENGLGAVSISWCDQICISSVTAQVLAEKLAQHNSVNMVFPTVELRDPYIHMQRDANGAITKVLHQREGDIMPAVGENDCGLFGLTGTAYFGHLSAYANEIELGAGTGERNFLPFIPWLAQRGAKVETFAAQSAMEAVGVNTPQDAAKIEQFWNNGE
jgi:bifunctional UDP-N-acetylglucosamine pyrophosphorylase / glucosamine-1-phosphate N-acetyltransferase